MLQNRVKNFCIGPPLFVAFRPPRKLKAGCCSVKANRCFSFMGLPWGAWGHPDLPASYRDWSPTLSGEFWYNVGFSFTLTVKNYTDSILFAWLGNRVLWKVILKAKNLSRGTFPSLPKLELFQNRIIFTLSNPIRLWSRAKTYSVFIVPLFEHRKR